jgi:hypothetical protein
MFLTPLNLGCGSCVPPYSWDAALKVLALRQQPAVLKRKRPRPPLNSVDRFFWTILRGIWSCWTGVLVIVEPETVVSELHTGYKIQSVANTGRDGIDERQFRFVLRLSF